MPAPETQCFFPKKPHVFYRKTPRKQINFRGEDKTCAYKFSPACASEPTPLEPPCNCRSASLSAVSTGFSLFLTAFYHTHVKKLPQICNETVKFSRNRSANTKNPQKIFLRGVGREAPPSDGSAATHGMNFSHIPPIGTKNLDSYIPFYLICEGHFFAKDPPFRDISLSEDVSLRRFQSSEGSSPFSVHPEYITFM